MDLSDNTFAFDKQAEADCDALAEANLAEIKRKRKLPRYRAIQYIENPTDDILLVCADGSMLYTPCELGKRLNLLAFESGLRTDPQALENRKKALEWESALS